MPANQITEVKSSSGKLIPHRPRKPFWAGFHSTPVWAQPSARPGCSSGLTPERPTFQDHIGCIQETWET